VREGTLENSISLERPSNDGYWGRSAWPLHTVSLGRIAKRARTFTARILHRSFSLVGIALSFSLGELVRLLPGLSLLGRAKGERSDTAPTADFALIRGRAPLRSRPAEVTCSQEAMQATKVCASIRSRFEVDGADH
jgi:hypothetical protein